MINSKTLNGLKVPEESIKKTIQVLEDKKLGNKKINFRLKDWGISRQRYWGCPIPIAYDENNNIVKVPEEKLPIILPENIDLNTQGNPLDHQNNWKKTPARAVFACVRVCARVRVFVCVCVCACVCTQNIETLFFGSG